MVFDNMAKPADTRIRMAGAGACRLTHRRPLQQMSSRYRSQLGRYCIFTSDDKMDTAWHELVTTDEEPWAVFRADGLG